MQRPWGKEGLAGVEFYLTSNWKWRCFKQENAGVGEGGRAHVAQPAGLGEGAEHANTCTPRVTSQVGRRLIQVGFLKNRPAVPESPAAKQMGF